MKRTLGFLLAATVIGGCSLGPSAPTVDGSEGTVPPVSGTPSARSAWTLLGDAPAPRAEAATIYDAARDQMLVFGPDGNDLWAQHFSGAKAGSWERITAGGELPPPSSAVMTIDESTQRLFVFASTGLDRAWVLPLDHRGTWTRIDFDSAPAIALGFSLATDRTGRRLFAYTSGQPEVWEVSLLGGTTWTRVAGSPNQYGFSCRDTLVYDGQHGRLLVLSGGWPRGNVFALTLEDGTWTKLNQDMAWFDYGSTAIYDAGAERFLVADPQQNDWVWSFAAGDLPTKWTHLPIAGSSADRRWHESSVYDGTHERFVLFGGRSSDTVEHLHNDTRAISLGDAPAWSKVGSLDTPLPMSNGISLASAGDRVVRFGSPYPTVAPTLAFDLKAGRFTPLGDGTPNVTAGTASAWDPVHESLWAYGGFGDPGDDRPYSLDLEAGQWTSVSMGGTTPGHRGGESMVFDAAGDRMLVFGGLGVDPNGQMNVALDDLWALSTKGDGWSKIEVPGVTPRGRYYAAVGFDEARRRLTVFGGYDLNTNLTDTWVLDLAPTPRWTQLHPIGDPPSNQGGVFGTFDRVSGRFLVAGSAITTDVARVPSGMVWTLSNDDDPRWEAYCPKGLRPGVIDGVAWTDRGLFVTSRGGSWVLDPATPLCAR